jgi:hypothetical protein
LADLLVELFDQCLLVLVRLPSALVKELGRSFNQGLLPGMDLGGVDFKPAGDFRDGLVSLERGQGYFGLEGRALLRVFCIGVADFVSLLYRPVYIDLCIIRAFRPSRLVNATRTLGARAVPLSSQHPEGAGVDCACHRRRVGDTLEPGAASVESPKAASSY